MREIKTKKGGTLYVMEKGETLNPNGRPRKGISLVNKQLADMGYTPAKKADIEETYLQLIQLTEKELKTLFEDKSQPILVKILASNMTNKSKSFDVIEKMLDRSIGKAIQKVQADIQTEVTFNPLGDRLKQLGLN